MLISKTSGRQWALRALRRLLFKLVYSPALEANGQFFISGADHIGQEIIVLGGKYEPENLHALAILFAKHELGRGVAIDVGANIGNHSRFFLDYFEHVICVEPNLAVAMVLEANLRLTGKTHWSLKRAALGAAEGTCELEVVNRHNLGSTRIREARAKRGTIPVTTGDSLILDPMVSGRKVDFVKIDVEGKEESVLMGMQQTLAKHKPMIALECLEQTSWRSIRTMLASLGYSDFLVLDRSPKGGPVGSAIKKLVLGTRVNLVCVRDEWPESGHGMVVCIAA